AFSSDATRVRFAAGLHPNSAGSLAEDWPGLTTLCRAPDCAAVGETGLDYHWDRATPEQQKFALDAHLQLADELGKPVVIHCRDAFADIFEHLALFPRVRGVLHCFSGGIAEARRALDLGYSLSFAGPLTYPRNTALREAAAFAPADRVVVETDAPFLPPQSRRGKTNEPACVVEVLATLAELRGIEFAAAAALTTGNAERLFEGRVEA
ncbi:MAG: TatD family hydrolase, partial [Planctomycetes bacterium]|nr:TatD family hydrolase [Planctomycetota bacterium]